MNRKLQCLFFFLSNLYWFSAQSVNMEFPYFAGKDYDFIIFQGNQQKTVYQGKIPADGKFVLTIPTEYAPYTGMSRWLITGTQEGGGLDMLIPGKNFSVSCLSRQPNNDNIIYAGNKEIDQMNNLHGRQEKIFLRYNAIEKALEAFPKTDKNYSVFEQKYKDQVKSYDSLQMMLKKEESYATEFIKIVNITRGIGPRIEDSEEQRARNIADFIANDMDWQMLYTSGHWLSVISSWIDIHTLILKDQKRFVNDFSTIGNKLSRAGQYVDFAERTAALLTQQGKDDLINAISPQVLASGKIAKYDGLLAVYTRGNGGVSAPDLEVTKDGLDKNETTILKIKDLLGKTNQKVLLVFYESGCGSCEKVLIELSKDYEKLSSAGVHIIGISSDKEISASKKNTPVFPGKEIYCDYKGFSGINFKNYGVIGTPTLILIDQKGKIQLRGAGLNEIWSALKQ